MSTVTIQLGDEDLAWLRQRASELGKRLEDLVGEIVAHQVDEEQRFREAVREGIADSDAGRVTNADEGFREVKSRLTASR